MQDAIMKGNGNSRYLKSVASFLSLYPTYEDFAQALMAGTLPIDLNGVNSAGWSQEGTPLNKASLLKDATAALYGLGTGAVPDEVLAKTYDILDDLRNKTDWTHIKTVTAASGATSLEVSLADIDWSKYVRVHLRIKTTGSDTDNNRQYISLMANTWTTQKMNLWCEGDCQIVIDSLYDPTALFACKLTYSIPGIGILMLGAADFGCSTALTLSGLTKFQITAQNVYDIAGSTITVYGEL